MSHRDVEAVCRLVVERQAVKWSSAESRPSRRAVLRGAVAVAIGVLAATAVAAQLPRARAEAVDMASDRLARVGVGLRRFVERDDIAGAVALVARRAARSWLDTAGYQDAGAKRPMRSTAIFRIASMTKPVTSVAVMILVEEGRLRLGDRVAECSSGEELTARSPFAIRGEDDSSPSCQLVVPSWT